MNELDPHFLERFNKDMEDWLTRVKAMKPGDDLPWLPALPGGSIFLDDSHLKPEFRRKP